MSANNQSMIAQPQGDVEDIRPPERSHPSGSRRSVRTRLRVPFIISPRANSWWVRTTASPKFCCLVAIAVTAIPASLCDAQSVRGRVEEDSSRTPISDALVVLESRAGVATTVRTDSAGRFLIHASSAGEYLVRVTRLGYQPLTSGRIDLSRVGSVVDLHLQLTALPTRLGTVVASRAVYFSRDELMSYMGFDLRRASGEGKFMDSLDLALFARQPLGPLLEDLRVHFGLEKTWLRDVEVIAMMTPDRMLCEPEIWLDGFQLPAPLALQRLFGIGADEIYGIEVYHPRQLPSPAIGGLIGFTRASGSRVRPGMLQGQSWRGDTNWRQSPRPCGALAVWTKRVAREAKLKQR